MFELNKTLTYQGFNLLWKEIEDFLITLGRMGCDFLSVLKYILQFEGIYIYYLAFHIFQYNLNNNLLYQFPKLHNYNSRQRHF